MPSIDKPQLIETEHCAMPNIHNSTCMFYLHQLWHTECMQQHDVLLGFGRFFNHTEHILRFIEIHRRLTLCSIRLLFAFALELSLDEFTFSKFFVLAADPTFNAPFFSLATVLKTFGLWQNFLQCECCGLWPKVFNEIGKFQCEQNILPQMPTTKTPPLTFRRAAHLPLFIRRFCISSFTIVHNKFTFF